MNTNLSKFCRDSRTLLGADQHPNNITSAMVVQLDELNKKFDTMINLLTEVLKQGKAETAVPVNQPKEEVKTESKQPITKK